MNGFTLGWIVLFALGFGLEALALVKGTGTLSGHVWALMGHPVARPAVLGFFVWLLWHWFAEPATAASLRTTYVDDGLIAAVVVFLSVLAGRRKA